MSYETPVAPTLFDLIAREWALGSGVEMLCFNADQSAVAFATASGLAIVPIADSERPEGRVRVAADTGRASIAPRKSPVRPAARCERLAPPVAAFGARAFVAANSRGGLASITPRGQDVPLPAAFEAPVVALDRDRESGTVAAAAGRRVAFLSEEGGAEGFEASGTITKLAYAPAGGALAVACMGGVDIRPRRDATRTISLDATPTRLSWSPDGAFLACGFETAGFALIDVRAGAVDWRRDYPTPVRSFGWSDGVLATAGAYRVAAWRLSSGGLGEPVEAGRPGLVVVEAVASCPTRPLIAAGYASGLVSIARIGGRDEMMLRAEGAPVTALEWSADGAHLALGCADGTAAVVSFPSTMFK